MIPVHLATYMYMYMYIPDRESGGLQGNCIHVCILIMTHLLAPLGPSTPWKGMAEPETMILPIAYTMDRLRMVLDTDMYIHVYIYR